MSFEPLKAAHETWVRLPPIESARSSLLSLSSLLVSLSSLPVANLSSLPVLSSQGISLVTTVLTTLTQIESQLSGHATGPTDPELRVKLHDALNRNRELYIELQRLEDILYEHKVGPPQRSISVDGDARFHRKVQTERKEDRMNLTDILDGGNNAQTIYSKPIQIGQIRSSLDFSQAPTQPMIPKPKTKVIDIVLTPKQKGVNQSTQTAPLGYSTPATSIATQPKHPAPSARLSFTRLRTLVLHGRQPPQTRAASTQVSPCPLAALTERYSQAKALIGKYEQLLRERVEGVRAKAIQERVLVVGSEEEREIGWMGSENGLCCSSGGVEFGAGSGGEMGRSSRGREGKGASKRSEDKENCINVTNIQIKGKTISTTKNANGNTKGKVLQKINSQVQAAPIDDLEAWEKDMQAEILKNSEERVDMITGCLAVQALAIERLLADKKIVEKPQINSEPVQVPKVEPIIATETLLPAPPLVDPLVTLPEPYTERSLPSLPDITISTRPLPQIPSRPLPTPPKESIIESVLQELSSNTPLQSRKPALFQNSILSTVLTPSSPITVQVKDKSNNIFHLDL